MQMSQRWEAWYEQPGHAMVYKTAWLSTARLTALGRGERDAAYWSVQLAAYNSASNTAMCHGRERRWDPVMEVDE